MGVDRRSPPSAHQFPLLVDLHRLSSRPWSLSFATIHPRAVCLWVPSSRVEDHDCKNSLVSTPAVNQPNGRRDPSVSSSSLLLVAPYTTHLSSPLNIQGTEPQLPMHIRGPTNIKAEVMILLRTSYTVWFSTSRESKHHRFIRAGPGKQLQQLLPNSSNVLANPKPLPNATTAPPQLHHVTQVGKNNRGFNTTKPKHTPKGMREEGIRTAASFSRNVRASQPPPDEHYIVGRRPHYDGTPASSRDLRVFRST